MVVIGDTPKDVAAAQAIGAESVGVGTGSFSAEQLLAAGATRAFATSPPPGRSRRCSETGAEPRRRGSRAAWTLLGNVEGLAARLRAAADALERASDVEAGWLRGAAALVERGAAGADLRPGERAVARGARPPRPGPGRPSLLSAWVAAAEALRAAVHLHESERGPLVEALFPEWRAPSLREARRPGARGGGRSPAPALVRLRRPTARRARHRDGAPAPPSRRSRRRARSGRRSVTALPSPARRRTQVRTRLLRRRRPRPRARWTGCAGSCARRSRTGRSSSRPCSRRGTGPPRHGRPWPSPSPPPRRRLPGSAGALPAHRRWRSLPASTPHRQRHVLPPRARERPAGAERCSLRCPSIRSSRRWWRR